MDRLDQTFAGLTVSSTSDPPIPSLNNSGTIGKDVVADWNTSQVSDWLETQGFPQLKQQFQNVTGQTLLDLNHDQLRQMGLTSLGERHKLLIAVKKLTSSSSFNLGSSGGLMSPASMTSSPTSPAGGKPVPRRRKMVEPEPNFDNFDSVHDDYEPPASLGRLENNGSPTSLSPVIPLSSSVPVGKPLITRGLRRNRIAPESATSPTSPVSSHHSHTSLLSRTGSGIYRQYLDPEVEEGFEEVIPSTPVDPQLALLEQAAKLKVSVGGADPHMLIQKKQSLKSPTTPLSSGTMLASIPSSATMLPSGPNSASTIQTTPPLLPKRPEISPISPPMSSSPSLPSPVRTTSLVQSVSGTLSLSRRRVKLPEGEQLPPPVITPRSSSIKGPVTRTGSQESIPSETSPTKSRMEPLRTMSFHTPSSKEAIIVEMDDLRDSNKLKSEIFVAMGIDQDQRDEWAVFAVEENGSRIIDDVELFDIVKEPAHPMNGYLVLAKTTEPPKAIPETHTKNALRLRINANIPIVSVSESTPVTINRPTVQKTKSIKKVVRMEEPGEKPTRQKSLSPRRKSPKRDPSPSAPINLSRSLTTKERGASRLADQFGRVTTFGRPGRAAPPVGNTSSRVFYTMPRNPVGIPRRGAQFGENQEVETKRTLSRRTSGIQTTSQTLGRSKSRKFLEPFMAERPTSELIADNLEQFFPGLENQVHDSPNFTAPVYLSHDVRSSLVESEVSTPPVGPAPDIPPPELPVRGPSPALSNPIVVVESSASSIVAPSHVLTSSDSRSEISESEQVPSRDSMASFENGPKLRSLKAMVDLALKRKHSVRVDETLGRRASQKHKSIIQIAQQATAAMAVKSAALRTLPRRRDSKASIESGVSFEPEDASQPTPPTLVRPRDRRSQLMMEEARLSRAGSLQSIGRSRTNSFADKEDVLSTSRTNSFADREEALGRSRTNSTAEKDDHLESKDDKETDYEALLDSYVKEDDYFVRPLLEPTDSRYMVNTPAFMTPAPDHIPDDVSEDSNHSYQAGDDAAIQVSENQTMTETSQPNSRPASPRPPSATMELRLNSTKINWLKGELIGRGSFGSVYHGLNLDTGEFMAVKQVVFVQPRHKSENDSVAMKRRKLVEALQNEISLLKELDHENIVKYLGCEVTEEFINVFLEYVPGGSISSMLSKIGSFDEALVRSLVYQILLGLDYLHQRGIMHRDIKGANILIDNDGTSKISDFGISKRNDFQMAYRFNSRMSLQGSVYWMAPEVIKGKGYSAKVDIWSLGCLVLEMFTGHHPWRQYDEIAALYRLGQSNNPTPPIPPDLSPEAQDFLDKCFQIDAELRPTAAQLLEHPFCHVDDNFNFQQYIAQQEALLAEEMDEDYDYDEDEYYDEEYDEDYDEEYEEYEDEMDQVIDEMALDTPGGTMVPQDDTPLFSRMESELTNTESADDGGLTPVASQYVPAFSPSMEPILQVPTVVPIPVPTAMPMIPPIIQTQTVPMIQTVASSLPTGLTVPGGLPSPGSPTTPTTPTALTNSPAISSTSRTSLEASPLDLDSHDEKKKKKKLLFWKN